MKLSDIDKNFEAKRVKPEDFDWFDYSSQNVSLHGVFYDKEEKEFKRLPSKIAKQVSEGVFWLHNHTAGGRLRFRTDSNTFALKAEEKFIGIMSHMPLYGQSGFSFYVDGKYASSIAPLYFDVEERKDNIICFDGTFELSKQAFKRGVMHDVEIYFPLYYNVQKLFVGIQKGCKIEKPNDYAISKPVLFYGSSITQGGCASHPGNDYPSILSRKFDFDFINLGFSGNGKAEDSIVEYIVGLDCSVYVMDYDHNAPSPEHLERTHYPMYEKIRKAHPNAPIIFMSKPDCDYRYESELFREKIKQSYKKARKSGDKNVYFINGKRLFGKDCRDACAVDNCHPNDLGFYRMAKTLEPLMKKLLRK
jgi:hypothetical protein